MKALIVHYHLKPGGVTTVLRRQLCALAAQGIDAAVLAGEAPEGALKGGCGSLTVEPALGYDDPSGGVHAEHGADPSRVKAIVESVRREADALGDDTIVHVHNPTIRKNDSLLEALSIVAASGRRMVFHVHDLAEDWRPDVYSRHDYPDGVTWAAINRYDVARLRAAGAGDVGFLPNPVPVPSQPAKPGERPRGPGLVLYPVRGIRRKNLGEAVLLSLFVRPGGSIGVTLPPANPRDFPYYDGWVRMAASIGAPIRFGLGLEHDFDGLYAQARAIVTTSIKEGFGLSYLEPASRNRITIGRRLPRVLADFEESGLSFPALYDSLAVPRELFDEDGFATRVADAVRNAAAAYGIDEAGSGLSSSVVDSVLGGSGQPDFGRLDEVAQSQVLLSLMGDSKSRAAFIAMNPGMDAWDAVAESLEPPSRESMSPWSEEAYGAHLKALYEGVLIRGGGAAPDKSRLLGEYLKPEAFHGVGV